MHTRLADVEEDTGTHVNQDYVFNWTRDAAVVAIELAAGPLPTSQPLINYVQFAQTCQNSASAIGHFGRASFLINGTPRNWSDQTDGRALQTLAILQMYAQLDAPTQAVASAVIAANLNFLQNAYQGETVNLWEEESGASFFARSVQLKYFQAISANTLGIGVPGWLSTAIPWLQNALASHWNGQYYRSLLPSPGRQPRSLRPEHQHRRGGNLRRGPGHRHQAPGDRRTAAQPVGRPGVAELLPDQRRRPAARHRRHARALSGGHLDGDTADPQTRDHPWAISTAVFAELYYQLAQQVSSSGTVPLDSLSATFFSQIGVNASTTPAAAAAALQGPATRSCRRSSSTATISS